jgi:competence protein ComEA
VKRNLDLEVVTYRRRYGMALLFISLSVIALSIFAQVSISAGQSAAIGQSEAHPEFPAGEGREAVMHLCSKCHSPNIILASGQDRTGWENTITKMVRLGAQGNDEDFSDIADYLTANFPPSPVKKIFINMATDKQIAAVLEISEVDAKAIVAYRDKIKGFQSIDDIKKVPGVDAKKIDANKDRLIFGAGSTKPAAN